jgi:GNAT superfamily N-acetyltransferase
MNRIIIRQAKQQDGKEFLSLINALADFEKLKRPTSTAQARLLRDAFGKKKRFSAYLAFINKKSVGYAIVFETYSSFLARPTLYLEDLFVLPHYRKQRIGLKLFRYCLKEAKCRRCGRMEWVVLDWNTNAIRFYDRLHARYMKEWLLYRITL